MNARVLKFGMLVVAIGVLAVLVPIATAVWQSPTQAFPGTGIVPPLTTGINPQTKTGALTVQGELSGFRPSSFLPVSGSPIPKGGVVANGGAASGSASVAAGFYGTSSGTSGGLTVGVYGIVGSNDSASVGVYGSSSATGGVLSWAGYFAGASDITGSFKVDGHAGTCIIDSPQHACFNIGECTSGPCSGASHPRVTVSGGKTTFSGSPAPTDVGTVAAYGFTRTSDTANDFNGVASGGITVNGASAEGQGAVGRIKATTPCAVSSLCAGVYGTDSSAVYDRPGRWGGYFNGSINATSTVSLAGVTQTIRTDEPQYLTTHPPQFANLPSGSFLGAAANTTSPWGVTYDGASLWVTRWNDVRVIAKLDPASFQVLASCIVNVGGGAAANSIMFDGRYLWYAGTTLTVRLDPQTVSGTGANCGGTAVAATQIPSAQAPAVVGSRLPGSINRSLWYAGRLTSGSIGTYLVEVDPLSMAVLSTTLLSATAVASVAVADDGTNVWAAGVSIAGTNVVLRIPKANKAAFTAFDYTSGLFGSGGSCPAKFPNCLSGSVDTYRGIAFGGGSIWVSVIDGPSTQRLLRIDPASAPAAGIGPLQNAYDVGSSYALAFDGRYLWTMNSPIAVPGTELKLYAVRASDDRTFTYPLRFIGIAGLVPRQMVIDRSFVYATENNTRQLIKALR